MSSAETQEKKPEEKKGKKTFVERIFHDDLEGEYDDEGFFTTPNGSFWDPDGVYFNREGYDKHGGYYDDNDEYVPGKGWDEENNCYKDELNEDEFASDHDPADEEENDGFHDVDLDNIPNEEKLIKVSDDIEKIEEDPNKIVHQIDENEDDKKEEEKKE
jgi:hypothetical protein